MRDSDSPMVTEEEAVSLLRRILQIDTTNPPGNELQVAQVLHEFFGDHGIEAEVDEFSPDRANLLARLPGGEEGRLSLLLCGHMDVVPASGESWDADPFAAELREGRIYGRGASDMKGGLVAMAVALVNLRQEGATLPGDVLFAATAGEEVDCRGARRLIERGDLQGVGAAIIAEPTREDVVVAHKGALWVEIATRGKTAHGSAPGGSYASRRNSHAGCRRTRNGKGNANSAYLSLRPQERHGANGRQEQRTR